MTNDNFLSSRGDQNIKIPLLKNTLIVRTGKRDGVLKRRILLVVEYSLFFFFFLVILFT